MIRTGILFASLSLAAVMGCASNESPVDDGAIVDADGDGKADGDSRWVVGFQTEGCVGEEAGTTVTLSHATLRQNRLDFRIAYRGKPSDQFSVCWDGTFTGDRNNVSLKLMRKAGASGVTENRMKDATLDLAPIAMGFKDTFKVSGKSVVNLRSVYRTLNVKLLPASQIEPAFKSAAEGAIYYSEGDSEPSWIETDLAADQEITGQLIIDTFADTFYADYRPEGELTFETEDGAPILASWSEEDPDADEYYAESSRAFARLSRLLSLQLRDITYFRIGPKDEDGEMVVDGGAYPLVIVGRTVDGKLVGFWVESVET